MESRRALSIVAAILAWITALPVALWVLFFGLQVRCDEACTGDGWQRSASGWQWHAVAASGAFLFLSATVLVVSVFRRRRWLAVLSVLTGVGTIYVLAGGSAIEWSHLGRRTSGELLFLGTAVSAPVLAALLTPPRRR